MNHYVKRALSVLMAIVLVFTCTVSASAGTLDTLAYAMMSPTELAYCDIDSAPTDAVRNAILEARKEIIFSKSWSVDGQVSVVSEDGFEEVLPKFDELFPGWEIPVDNDINSYTNTAAHQEYASAFSIDGVILYQGVIYLNESSSTTNAEPFTTFYTEFTGTIEMKATSIPGTTWNAGITNMKTGESVAYIMHIPEGKAVKFTHPAYHTYYGARASSNGLPGPAAIQITQALR